MTAKQHDELTVPARFLACVVRAAAARLAHQCPRRAPLREREGVSERRRMARATRPEKGSDGSAPRLLAF